MRAINREIRVSIIAHDMEHPFEFNAEHVSYFLDHSGLMTLRVVMLQDKVDVGTVKSRLPSESDSSEGVRSFLAKLKLPTVGRAVRHDKEKRLPKRPCDAMLQTEEPQDERFRDKHTRSIAIATFQTDARVRANREAPAAHKVEDEEKQLAHATVCTALSAAAVPGKRYKICNVPGCQKFRQGRPVSGDALGPPGRRCHLHGAIRQRCTVVNCLNWSKGKVAHDDIFGQAGYRCWRHGVVVQCSIEGCANKAVRKIENHDQFGAPGRRCGRHGFSVTQKRKAANALSHGSGRVVLKKQQKIEKLLA